LYDIRLIRGNDITLSSPKNYNTGLLVLEGKLRINNKEFAKTDQFALFKNDGDKLTISALDDSIILFLSGLPINENIYPYGPFLMNTKSEIAQAIDDYNSGKFGHLE
jgi:redox-sensitive bicupin YhaK (pirin superfamily)